MANPSAYTAYFDAGGHPSDQPFVVVSGYIANIHQWKLFNRMWEAIHKEYDVALPFHASDFYARKKQYTKWELNDPKATEFITTLASAQQIYMLVGLSCIVDMGTYREIDDVFQLQTMLPAYALGARSCVSMIEQWLKQFDIRHPCECIFEDGDFGRGKFIELMRVERMPAPIFKDKKDCPGLQAADHIAWEQGNYLKQERAGKPVELNHPFSQLLAIPHIHFQTTLESLLSIAEAKGIPIKRSKIIRL